jgi:hypothetical protein
MNHLRNHLGNHLKSRWFRSGGLAGPGRRGGRVIRGAAGLATTGPTSGLPEGYLAFFPLFSL